MPEETAQTNWKAWFIAAGVIMLLVFTLGTPGGRNPEKQAAATQESTTTSVSVAQEPAPVATTAAPKQTTTTVKPAPSTPKETGPLGPQGIQGVKTTTTLHLAAVHPKKGMSAASIGIKGRGDLMMPDDCQDPKVTGMQNMVHEVNERNNPKAPDYITNADVPGYVCAWD